MATETRLFHGVAPVTEVHEVPRRNPGPPPILHLVQRTAAVEALGWPQSDAEWLALVCLNSGVSTRHQYGARYICDKHAASRFVQRLTARGSRGNMSPGGAGLS